MNNQNKVEILVRYKNNKSNKINYSFIENSDYETALRKFLKIKGGKTKITIISIQDWDRLEKRFTIEKPITIEDKKSVVYKIMNEYYNVY